MYCSNVLEQQEAQPVNKQPEEDLVPGKHVHKKYLCVSWQAFTECTAISKNLLFPLIVSLILLS